MLRRADFYLGYAVYRRGRDVRPGSHQPIISAEQRDAAVVTARLRHRAGRPDAPRRVYPLQRLVQCLCGLPMWAETQSRPGRRDFRYYRCPGRRDGRCSQPNVSADRAERTVIEHLAARRAPPELVALEREELRSCGIFPRSLSPSSGAA